MDNLQAVIVGSIQGVSEFLPISSSAHIVFAQSIYKFFTNSALIQEVSNQEIFFDIMVHLATLLAVVIFFFKDIVQITKNFFISLFKKDYKNSDFKIALYIIAATPVTVCIGLLLKDVTHSLVENPKIVSLFLILTGFILFYSEKLKSSNKEHDLKSSLLTGLAQGLAVFPGLSRSGLTIATQVFLGIDRVKAARFSFLMSIPVILGASLFYPLVEMNYNEMSNFNYEAIAYGFIASFIVGYICIKFFMDLLAKVTLKCFAYYCFAAGALMFVLFSSVHHLQ